MDSTTVLEIGSGTGQHGVYFAEHLPHIHWQTSDLCDNHDGIIEWIEESELGNIAKPIELDVSLPLNHTSTYSAIFTANTLHIMNLATAESCLEKTAQLLISGGLLIVYGPFKYEGQFTSESNAGFDQWLKTHDPERGIRDFERIHALLEKNHFKLIKDHKMPANNQLIVWQKEWLVILVTNCEPSLNTSRAASISSIIKKANHYV